ncbi:MAG: 30S ribosomal protein S12 methylthiotransferase RimO [Lachnospiraceae bacterium]|nr:30S ribosomal protein S12 methylthiotransferase RimO [Lachnospiraceae bacterium]
MKGRVFFRSLGCDKNLVDSEMMLRLLSEAGWELTDDVNEADAAVVNSCCFIMDAKEESINTLIELGALKSEGQLKALIVTGCLAQRYAEEIHEELPEVDALVGTSAFDRIAKVLDSVMEKQPQDALEDISRPLYGLKRILSTGGHYAYLKIAEGCDRKCTYCAIPAFRGHYRSVPMDVLIREAEELAAGGVRELILVAQETTRYGIDLYGKKSLSELLHRLCGIEELRWIRLLYSYPEEIDDELIECIASEEKICHYLDLPIQHSEDRILSAMGRRTRRQELKELIARLRERIPDICLRTSLIVGFPGENEEDIAGLEAFVKEICFDRLGVFCYSPEEGTPAAELPGQIDEDIKQQRQEQLMTLQQSIVFEKGEALIGDTLRCMVEGRIPEEELLVLRSYRDAPEVDGYVFVKSSREYMSGTLLDIRITACREYDLIGEIAHESAE